MHRSQSALEYMMTYGWAILIIVIVAGVLYSLGIFNPSTSAGTTVTGFSGFSVQAQCVPGGAEQIMITNGVGYAVNITGVNSTGNGQSTNIKNAYVYLTPLQSTSYYLQGVCPTSSGSRYSVQVTLTYKEPSQTFSGPYFSSGTTSGSVASSSTPTLSASFNGVNSYILTQANAFRNSSYTVSVWVFIKSTTPGHYQDFVASGNNTCTTNRDFEIGTNVNTPLLNDYTAFCGDDLSNNVTTFSTGVWYNVVTEWNKTSRAQQAFLNGVSNLGPRTASGYLATGTTQVCLGGGTTGCWNPNVALNGSLSNVQIYSTYLSSSQIQQLYSEGIGGAPLSGAGLIGWWPLNGNALDFSGNGYNGVLSSVTWGPG